MTLRIYCVCICMSTVNFTKISKVSRISIVSRTPFFGCEVSCKKVRLLIRKIRYRYEHTLQLGRSYSLYVVLHTRADRS